MAHKRSRAAFESETPPTHAPYAVYGTPLPAYDPDARDDGSYVPIWKQEVTDERGRKRLHGAFTGGFSAGYFNTVGSKEGWTPSTFRSSRDNRVKDAAKGGRVEDFMDEEDLAERAESQKLEMQGPFAGLGGGVVGEGGKGMFADLFRAAGDSVGVKLLQRMGWRQGQGIGPKVKRRAKGDKDGEVHLFAPENTSMISFNRKTDRKGIGFAGQERLADPLRAAGDVEDEEDEGQDARILQSSRSKLLAKPTKSGLKKSGGFGTGVLNDTGSDDEDDEAIMGPRISYNRVIGGDRIKPKKRGGLTASNASQKPLTFTSTSSKKLEQRTNTLSGFRKCHDGRLPLDGFVLTSTPLVILVESQYPPPSVPENWKPSRLSNSTDTTNNPYQSTADAAKASTLDPKSRAALLGEQQLPGKSVFDFLSPAARERLSLASGRADLPPALNEKAPAGYQQSDAETRRSMWELVPDLEKATVEAALARGRGGFMPYAEDEAKRERYAYFLELKSGKVAELPRKPTGMGTEEWAKELREFARAAEVFRPISGLMASRFTSSVSSGPRLASDVPDAAPRREESDDPAEQAAKLGIFGPGLTRSRARFFPTRLLCKRFNVKPPANVDPGAAEGEDGAASSSTGTKDVVSQASLDRMMREANWGGGLASSKGGGKGFVPGGVEGGDEDAVKPTRQAPDRVDIEKNEALEAQKAGEEVFKAIFGSDDEDDE